MRHPNRPLVAWGRRPERERPVPCQGSPRHHACFGTTFLNGAVCPACLPIRPEWRREDNDD